MSSFEESTNETPNVVDTSLTTLCPEILQNVRVAQMKRIQTEALELFTRKNADYGDAFAKYGVIGVLMRIEDKIQRAMSITKNGVNLVNDEGIYDTLLDLHNYAAMALMLLGEGGPMVPQEGGGGGEPRFPPGG